MKKVHRYRVTVEHLQHAQPDGALHAPLEFQAANHDEILGIVDRLREQSRFDADTTAALAIGLKLFGEVALKHREEAMFTPVLAALREFIQQLKSGGLSAPPAERNDA